MPSTSTNCAPVAGANADGDGQSLGRRIRVRRRRTRWSSVRGRTPPGPWSVGREAGAPASNDSSTLSSRRCDVDTYAAIAPNAQTSAATTPNAAAMRQRRLMAFGSGSRRRARCARAAPLPPPPSWCAGSRCTRRASASRSRSRSPRCARRSCSRDRTMPAFTMSSSSTSNSVFVRSSCALAAPRGAALRVEHEVADPDDVVGRPTRLERRSSAAHPRRQLVERERLHDVVVGAGVEPGDPIGHLVARGQHQDRQRHRAGAQSATHGEAVDVRHHDVEHEEIGRSDVHRGQRLLAVVSPRTS